MSMTVVHSDEKRKKDMEYYHFNKNRILENRRKRYEANPSKFTIPNTKAQRKRRTGFTPEEYDNLMLAQGGRCYLCEEIPSGSALHADHCHATGTKRKLLCGSCNKGLGSFKDNPQLLIKAAEYLRAHGGSH